MQKYIENSTYPVTVVKIYSKGILVLLHDTGQTDFIHISKISSDFIQNIEDYVSVGDEFEAIAIKRTKQPKSDSGDLELSLKHLNLKSKVEKVAPVLGEQEQKTEITLDDMIESANKVLQEKLHAIDSKCKHSGYKRNRRQNGKTFKDNR